MNNITIIMCFFTLKGIFTQIINIRICNNYFFKILKFYFVLIIFPGIFFLGILGLGNQNFSYVTVEIWETTQKGQSSHRAKVLRDGSFAMQSDWILEAPGKYEFSKLGRADTFFLNKL